MELLIRIYDKVNSDPVLDRQCFKAGDIIHVAPDGWLWGTEELINPDWRIVKFPGVNPALWMDMLEADVLKTVAPDGKETTRLIRKRRKSIDMITDPTILPYLRAAEQVVTPTNGRRKSINYARAVKQPMNVVVVG